MGQEGIAASTPPRPLGQVLWSSITQPRVYRGTPAPTARQQDQQRNPASRRRRLCSVSQTSAHTFRTLEKAATAPSPPSLLRASGLPAGKGLRMTSAPVASGGPASSCQWAERCCKSTVLTRSCWCPGPNGGEGTLLQAAARWSAPLFNPGQKLLLL